MVAVMVEDRKAYTQQQFIDKLRLHQPHKFRMVSDSALLREAHEARPDFFDTAFKPEPSDDPGFFEALWQPTKEFGYRLPETAATVVFGSLGILDKGWNRDDPTGPTDRAKKRTRVIESAKGFTNDLVAKDQELQQFHKWAGENPFEWGKFFTKPAMFASTFSSVLTSMGTVMAAGAIGGLVAGPVGAGAGAFATGFSLEGSEAYGQAYEMAKELGMSQGEIEGKAEDAMLYYGVASGILESIVPLSILRMSGFGSRVAKRSFGRYQSKVLKSAVEKPALSSLEASKRAIIELSQENLSMATRIKSMARFSSLEQLSEAGTEGLQYLTEQAILDGHVSGKTLNGTWLKEKLNDPEFHQSIAGGLQGGGFFSALPSVRKAMMVEPERAAEELSTLRKVTDHTLGPAKSEEIYSKTIDNILEDDNFSHDEKVAFSKRLAELDMKFYSDQIKEELPIEEPVVETPIKPVQEPTVTAKEKKKELEVPEKKPVEAVKQIRGIAYDIGTGKTDIDKDQLDIELDVIENKIEKGTFKVTDLDQTSLYKLPIDSYGWIKQAFKDNPTEALSTLKNQQKIEEPEKQPVEVKKEPEPTPTEPIAKVERPEIEAPEVTTPEPEPQQPNITERLLKGDKKLTIKGRDKSEKLLSYYLTPAKMKTRQGEQYTQPYSEYRDMAPAERQKVNDNLVLALNRLDIEKTGVKVQTGSNVLKTIQELHTQGYKIEFTETPSALGGKITTAELVGGKPPTPIVSKRKEFVAVGVKQGGSVHEVLKNIGKVDPKYKTLTDLLVTSIPQDFTIDIFKDGPSGRYTPGTKQVGIKINGGKGQAGVNRLIVHEAIHAATTDIINAVKSGKIDAKSKRGKAVADLQKVLDVVKAQVGEKELARAEKVIFGDKNSEEWLATRKKYYALVKGGNVSELVQETMNPDNVEFRKFLSEIKMPGRKDDMWQMTKKYIKKIVGIDVTRNTALGRTLEASLDLFEDAKTPSTEGKPIRIKLEVSKKNKEMLKKDPDDIELRILTADDALLSRNTKTSEGGWRITYFNSITGSKQPVSHVNYTTYEKAVAALKQVEQQKKPAVQQRDEEHEKITGGGLKAGRSKDEPINFDERTEDTFTVPDFASLPSDRTGTAYEFGLQFRGSKAAELAIRARIDELESQVDTLVDTNTLEAMQERVTLSQTAGIYREALGGVIGDSLSLQFLESRTPEQRMDSKKQADMLIQEGNVEEFKTTKEEENDNREGTNFSEDLDEDYQHTTDTFLNNIFFEEFDVYLTSPQYASMLSYVKQHANISFKDDGTFDVYFNNLIQKVRNDTGQPIEIKASQLRKMQNSIKIFHQRNNSRTDIAREDEAPYGKHTNYQLVADEKGNVIRLHREPFENPVTKKKNPRSTPTNFLEGDGVEVIYLPISNAIMSDGDGGFKSAKLVVGGNTIEQIEGIFAKEFLTGKSDLLSVMLESQGDNSQIVIARTSSGKSKIDTYSLLEKYVSLEVDRGNMTDKHKKAMLASVADLTGMEFAQVVGVHEAFKRSKGEKYLLRENNVADTFKRFKLDTSKGWMPRGVGKSSVMLVDTKDKSLRFTAPDRNGIDEDVNFRKEDGSYAWDGWMMTSKNYMKKIGKVSGLRLENIKTVIRSLETNADGTQDYAAFKMMEMVPFEGMKVYEGDKLIAEYDGNTWKDSKGNEFDRLATNDELKDKQGKYENFNEIHELPEKATRVLMTNHKQSMKGPHPILGWDLLVSDSMLGTPEGQRLYNEIKNHYNMKGAAYLNEMVRLRKDYEAFRKFAMKDLTDGEIPSEVQKYIQKFSGKALYMKSVMQQLLPILANRFFNDGLLKGRPLVKGISTKLLIKPAVGLNIEKNEIMISSDNQAVRDMIFEAMGESATIETANNWLAENDFWVLVHRQPIQSGTKVQPRKIKRLVEGGHGNVAFLNIEDVWNVHEADHDGDTIGLERVEQSLVDAMLAYQETSSWKARDKSVDLGIFKNNIGDTTVASRTDRIARMNDNMAVDGAQGIIVNAKTQLSVMFGKKISFKVRGSGILHSVLDPEGVTVMDYWNLDYENKKDTIDTFIRNNNAELVKKGNNYHLKTTREHEFSILLQAAVDNAKYGLVGSIRAVSEGTKLFEFILSRMWNNVAGNKKALNIAGQIGTAFNYSRPRRGKNFSNRDYIRPLQGHFAMSHEIHDRFFKDDGSKQPVASTIKIVSDRVRGLLNAKANTLGELNMNNSVAPSEILLSAAAKGNKILFKQEFDNYGNNDGTPFEFTPNRYLWGHAMGRAAVVAKYGDRVRDLIAHVEGLSVEGEKTKAMNAIRRAMSMMDSLYKEYKAVVEKERVSNKGKDKEVELMRHDYSEDFVNIIDKYEGAIRGLGPLKTFSTIYFLNGLRREDGRTTKNVNKLLPLQLMDYNVVAEYAEGYYNGLTDMDIPSRPPARTDRVSLDRQFEQIERLKGKYCG